MTPERWEQVERLYHAALAQDPAGRERFLENACGGDEELRREVESLLAEEAHAGNFIESPAIEVAARDLAGDAGRLATGRRLGSYEVLGLLGEGGMGQVYKARDVRLGRTVAIKTLPANQVKDRERVQRFMNEARLASSLNHPNVAHIYEIAELPDTMFIAMELVEGQTLASVISGGALDEARTIEIALQVADALDAAHTKGIIHRDIKPANIMLTPRGQVKVLDFGVAKLTAPRERNAAETITLGGKTASGLVMGTLHYMSPEQVLGRELDVRTDLFSLGVVLYQTASGHAPFRGASQPETLDSLLHEDPAPVSRWSPAVSAELERIARKCLEKDRDRRYQSAHDLIVDLKNLQRDHISGAVSRDSTGRHKPPAGRPPRWVAAALILTGVAAAGWFAWRSRPGARGPGLSTGRLTLLVSAETDLDEPDLSPDGKMIVYTAVEGGQTDLFLARVSGGSRIRLTNDKAVESNPSFSPDAERILFTRFRQGSPPEVLTIPTLGGDATPVLRNAIDAVWSPDGHRLVFVQSGPSQALAVSAADGGQERVLLDANASYPFVRNPAWSPDGTQIAVERSIGGAAGETWLVPLNGKQPRKLTQDGPGVFSHSPQFTVDGRNIVDSSNRGGSTNLWLVPLDGAARVRLTTGPGPDASPAVSRSGAIAFENSRSRSSLLIHDLARHTNREILTHPFYLWAPSFSPDGTELAFSRCEAAGLWHLWTIPVQGGAARQITSSDSPEIYPRFTPDGGSIVYHTWTSGPNRVFSVARGGGLPTALTPARSEDDNYAEVSPDGRRLAFARTEKGTTRVWIAPMDGGAPHLLLDSAATLPHWSPDGRWIAFSPSRDHQAGIFVVGADGTGLRRLSQTGSWPVWWPDGKHIGYLAPGPDGNQQIFTVPFDGGESVPFTGVHFRGNNFPFDVSRDGSLLATTNSVLLTAEIWMLELR